MAVVLAPAWPNASASLAAWAAALWRVRLVGKYGAASSLKYYTPRAPLIW